MIFKKYCNKLSTVLTQSVPDYAEAWREKGVVGSLINRLVPADKRPDWLPSGEESLRQATIARE
jgi:hypothetical protein